MTETKKKKSILADDAYVSGKKEIVLDYKGEKLILFADEVGYLNIQHLAEKAKDQDLSFLALLAAECISDSDGNKFTYEELTKLKQEFVEPIFKSLADLFHLDVEKN